MNTTRIWFVGCTHGEHQKLIVPENIEIVIHTGDFSNYRSAARNANEAIDFFKWYSSLEIPYKILIAGNHDSALEARMVNPPKNVIYLENESVNIGGIDIYGSPYSPEYNRWSFMLPRGGESMRDNWALIPDKLDILVTHTPPKYILDYAIYDGLHAGCELLAERLVDIDVKIHAFSHIHEQGNQILIDQYNSLMYMNVCAVNFDWSTVSHGYVLNYVHYN